MQPTRKFLCQISTQLFAEFQNLQANDLGTGSTGLGTKYLADDMTWKTVSLVETDPIYTASSWFTTTNNSANWDTAFSWGNHASAGYLLSYTETDPVWLADKPSYLTSATAASTYEPIISSGLSSQYWRGDKTWQTLDKTAVGYCNYI